MVFFLTYSLTSNDVWVSASSCCRIHDLIFYNSSLLILTVRAIDKDSCCTMTMLLKWKRSRRKAFITIELGMPFSVIFIGFWFRRYNHIPTFRHQLCLFWDLHHSWHHSTTLELLLKILQVQNKLALTHFIPQDNWEYGMAWANWNTIFFNIPNSDSMILRISIHNFFYFFDVSFDRWCGCNSRTLLVINIFQDFCKALGLVFFETK